MIMIVFTSGISHTVPAAEKMVSTNTLRSFMLDALTLVGLNAGR
jgi:hypothetical protein